MWRVCLLLLLVVKQTVSLENLFQDVSTKVGTFVGLRGEATFEGVSKSFTEFHGIPYAEAPTGQLRFRKPVPKSRLESIFNATYARPACPQLPFLKFSNFPIDEDCLRLDIYVPDYTMQLHEKDQFEGLSVLIFIHGGAFQLGSTKPYIFDRFSTFGEVIVVTIAYRLSVFGFLSTGDDVSPGNYGLWDQHLAIKWVHDNIEAFGGDPKRVTVFGVSAGGASVLLQALYPGNKGFFQRIIPRSGAFTNPWAFSKSPDYSKFASRAGCMMKTSKATLDCLRAKSTEELFKDLNKGSPTWYEYGFTVVRDGEFVKENPSDLIENAPSTSDELNHFASLDVLIGLTNLEGTFYMLTKWPFVLNATDTEALPLTREMFEQSVLPEVLRELYADGNPESALGKAIRFQYTDWTDPDNVTKIREMLLQLSADYPFIAGIVQVADVHSQMSPKRNTFFYHSTAKPSQNVIFRNIPRWMKGVGHAEDNVFFVGFSRRFVEAFGEYFEPTTQDLSTAKFVMKVMSNFAKSGNPNEPVPLPIKWPPYTAESREYVELSHEMTDASVKKRFGEPWVSFWLELVPTLWDVSKTEQQRQTTEHVHTEF